MTKLTLRTRLTLFYTGVLAMLVTALGVTYYRVLRLQLDRDATAELTELTSGLHGYLRFDQGGQPMLVYDANDADQVAFVEAASRYYQVFDATSGRLLAQANAMEPLGLQYTPAEVRSFRDRPRVVDVQTDRGRLRLSNSLITTAGGMYLLQVGVSLETLDAALGRFLRLLLWSVPIGLLAVVVIGRMMAARSLAPLADLASRTRAITVADLTHRLPVRGTHDELDAVAEAFNDTLGRLEHAVGEMKQFSAAIAHELRTPLAALRGEAELALLRASTTDDYRRTLESQLEEFDKLSRLITQLLTLARAEAGEIPLADEPVDLSALANSVTEQLEPVAAARDIALRSGTVEPAVVTGDRHWLERLLLNLLDNAIKFTAPGGRITVNVQRRLDGAAFEIVDTGIGIAPDALPHIFERFFRADAARSGATEGAGLGLSLVKWIVDRHHGTIDVASRPGEGTRVVVALPDASGQTGGGVPVSDLGTPNEV